MSMLKLCLLLLSCICLSQAIPLTSSNNDDNKVYTKDWSENLNSPSSNFGGSYELSQAWNHLLMQTKYLKALENEDDDDYADERTKRAIDASKKSKTLNNISTEKKETRTKRCGWGTLNGVFTSCN